ncbi:DUF732 domain-containing protein [Actinomycetospora cinnamomea]|uniref:Uncharacterized protein DUF732 n=1 Tax=Actinomycetospora cinnamomea TaxID=663609 RepID=A0A2U1E7H5_9PSEU|nr:uncharacterized protein DUF732 [Actinomycetospora cinnamomea]
MRLVSRGAATTTGLAVTGAALLVGCAFPVSTPPPSPPNVVVVPAPAQPPASAQTQYVPYPHYTVTYAPPPTYYPPSYYSADADFLSRLEARDIVTPSEGTRIAGGRQVCSNISAGSSITPEANKLMDEPYDYSAALAGYFAGEAIKVYCPQYAYQLSG